MTIKDIQTKSGKFTISAFDQRGSLGDILGNDPGTEEGRHDLEEMKSVIMETFSPICSGVLVDPDFGFPSLQKKDEHAGLLLTLESYDYSTHSQDSLPTFNSKWGVREIADHHAAVKLLLFYNPKSSKASEKRLLVKQIYEQSQKSGVPFVFEPLLHPIEGSKEDFKREHFVLYKQMIQDFTHICDVLKIEFPIFSTDEFDEKIAADRCQEISSLASVPWILLSRGITFERYILALQTAMKNGAKGFAVGRAVWKDIGNIPAQEDQYEFIRTVGKERMMKLIDVVES